MDKLVKMIPIANSDIEYLKKQPFAETEISHLSCNVLKEGFSNSDNYILFIPEESKDLKCRKKTLDERVEDLFKGQKAIDQLEEVENDREAYNGLLLHAEKYFHIAATGFGMITLLPAAFRLVHMMEQILIESREHDYSFTPVNKGMFENGVHAIEDTTDHAFNEEKVDIDTVMKHSELACETLIRMRKEVYNHSLESLYGAALTLERALERGDEETVNESRVDKNKLQSKIDEVRSDGYEDLALNYEDTFNSLNLRNHETDELSMKDLLAASNSKV